ncbi:nuclear transport factor 2 family protein [Solimicrobium silvestre]
MLVAYSANAQTPDADAAFRQQVNAFLDEWHDDAAHANYRYFDKIAKEGVYIGTDKSERWVRDDFKAWAKPYFDKHKAWTFHAIKRNVAFSDDKSFIWFDEQLNTQMGICQASGVIRNTKDGLKIEHYQLSLTVPNPLVPQIQKEISDFDARQAHQ